MSLHHGGGMVRVLFYEWDSVLAGGIVDMQLTVLSLLFSLSDTLTVDESLDKVHHHHHHHHWLC
jgi:hypothetical protein